MATSIKTLLILKPDQREYVLIDPEEKEPYLTRAIGFPIYSSDFVLGVDRYPEYVLIRHLPNKDIFDYFLNPTKPTIRDSNNAY